MSVKTDENRNFNKGNLSPRVLEDDKLPRGFTGPSRLVGHDRENNNIKMGSLPELQSLIHSKDEKIKDLQRKLQERDEIITQLRSQLDKYQSVIPQSLKATARPRKQRAQGISAEPHSAKDLVKTSNKKHSKTDRYVVHHNSERHLIDNVLYLHIFDILEVVIFS